MSRKTVFACCVATLILFAPHLRAQTGTISADPNPCEIYLIQDLCLSTISWSSQAVSLVEVWVATSAGESLFATTGRGGPIQKAAPWIQDQDYTFSLYDYSSGARGVLLASVTVRGQRSLRCEPPD